MEKFWSSKPKSRVRFLLPLFYSCFFIMTESFNTNFFFLNYNFSFFFDFLKKLFFLQSKKNKSKEEKKKMLNWLVRKYNMSTYLFFLVDKYFSQPLFFFDIFFVFLLYSFDNAKTSVLTTTRLNFRLAQSQNGLFLSLLNNNPNKKYEMYFLHGLQSFWLGLRFWFLSLVLGLLAFYVLMSFRFVPLLKISFQWLCIVMFLYWLMSGFVFFIKKYQTSKFTTVIQRFWRRTYILFWLIETCVFVTFLYLTFNASQEPFYMHDQIKVFKTHFFSWRYLLIKVIGVAVLIIISYCLLLFLKWNIFTKQSILFFFVTLFLTYVVWLEFYQFFHIISYYGGLFWSFDVDDRIWVLENDFKRSRLVNNYVALCLMAKFWHLIFIYVFWIFFILRANELKRYRYPLLSANLQNFIILYIMCWLFMYPWFKYYGRKYMDYTYYWFFTNSRELGSRVFFNDLKLFFFSFINSLIFDFSYYFKFYTTPYFYWIESSYSTNFDGYRKHFIKNVFLSNYYSNIF